MCLPVVMSAVSGGPSNIHALPGQGPCGQGTTMTAATRYPGAVSEGESERIRPLPAGLTETPMSLVVAMLWGLSIFVPFRQAEGQSRIDRGPQHTFLVTSTATGQVRAPFLPLGWWDVGVCTPTGDPTTSNDSDLLAHLDSLARYGSNLVLMQDAADGRLVARRFWQTYPISRQIWFDVDGDGNGDYQRGFGHPDPQVFVRRLRWFMDEAVGRGIFTMIGVGRFIVPIPDQEVDWKDNLARIVDELKSHPGLFGWYLFDEPEVNGPRTAAKGAIFGNEQSAYAGPSCGRNSDGTLTCAATTDLLREAFRVIKQRDADHIVAVSVNNPQHFYSPDRFDWAYTWSGLNGPFDLDPMGRVEWPADVVGVNLNPFVREPTDFFYQDPNEISRAMQMVDEAVRTDGAWGSIYLAAQAQVASAEGRLPCRAGDNDPFRPQRDQDILWQLLTPFIDGARGLLQYSHALTPDPGTGTSDLARTQRQRIHRAMYQFREAGLDSMLLGYPVLPEDSSWRLDSVLVKQLTDDYHQPFVKAVEPKQADSRRTAWESPEEYVRSRYNRGSRGRSARMDRPGINMAGFRHMRIRVLRLSETSRLLMLSNAYDARIEVAVSMDRPAASVRGAGSGREDLVVERAMFDLQGDGRFSWKATPEFVRSGAARNQVQTLLRIPLDPYAVEVFRVELRPQP